MRGEGGRPHIVKISHDAAQTVDRNSSRVPVIGRMVSGQPGLPLHDQQSLVTSGQAESGASGAPGHSGSRSGSKHHPIPLGRGSAQQFTQSYYRGPGFRPKAPAGRPPQLRPRHERPALTRQSAASSCAWWPGLGGGADVGS